MIRSAREHVLKFDYGLKPYRDTSRQMVGVVCEHMHEVWQMDVVLINNQLEKDPAVRELVRSYQGLQDLARILTKGLDSAPEKYEEAIRRIREDLVR